MPCWEGVSGRGETNVLSQETGMRVEYLCRANDWTSTVHTDAVCRSYDYIEGAQSRRDMTDIQYHTNIIAF